MSSAPDTKKTNEQPEDLLLLLETIKEAALLAGELLRNGYPKIERIRFDHKGASDFVTEYDKGAEALIIKHIMSKYPKIGFVAEESGIVFSKDSEYKVIIDPLDGTNNFVHGIPHFSVSIAVAKNTELVCGVVYQPLLDEMLSAAKGLGARLNDVLLEIKDARPFSEMLLSTCLPYNNKGNHKIAISQINTLMPLVAGIRCPGSAALEIAYIALGRFDAFWSHGAQLDLWDIAAGIVIAREAGYLVTDLDGNITPEEWSSLLVSHPNRHTQLLTLLEKK
ncbi:MULTISPECIES: inositol monophosphatase family protein [Marinomonas]|uniref:Inositol-1-monophosphatase n=1 Tax=Marinomonas posidonica (strain CECT 7376 / NCIMB 14433 / IVIA-Po-181) TaxID=491952 RepID=F6CSV0_MARPP|nr:MULTISPECIES: inositol monophosphatase family protein [Marinomonas]AEF53940.1 inositol monophosphatase [Marinomonas posidonica IVIA-Po-181]WCN10078.1 inositol monophosphatase [Marinomonas mediterranea]